MVVMIPAVGATTTPGKQNPRYKKPALKAGFIHYNGITVISVARCSIGTERAL
ncbi:hypothetical protein JCM19238_4604 [Vibrio ponticus]|nr:hypothetical protein JCM19238_4604 [Vibrio ponticus]